MSEPSTRKLPDAPRITPGGRDELGFVNWRIARTAGRFVKGGPPNVFTTLGRNRRLFRPWLRFAGTMMPRGKLPRIDTELVILRVAANTRSPYEWHQHAKIGKRAGLKSEQVEALAGDAAATVFSPRQQVLLSATDELHSDNLISDETWAALRPEFTDPELIELCLLAGHYEMLAGMLNSLGVQVEDARPIPIGTAAG